MSGGGAAASDVGTFSLSQLSTYGIVVNPQWTIPDLQSEDLYLLGVESIRKVLVPRDAAAAAACISWLEENSPQENAASLHGQVMREVSALPGRLSASAKERFDACSTLMQALKAIAALPEHVDYSAIMYPNEKNSRDLISALLERLADHSDRVRALADQRAADAAAAASSSSADVVTQAFANLRNRPPAAGPFAAPDARRYMRVATGNKPVSSLKRADQVVSTTIHNNALRRLALLLSSIAFRRGGGGVGAGGDGGEEPDWVRAAFADADGGKAQRRRRKRGDQQSEDAADALLFGSVADIAPQQAAAQEREAAEVRARLRSAEANEAAMRTTVQDAQRARELEDTELTARLRDLKASIKGFKSNIRTAKDEMEALEQQFLELEADEADSDARHEAALAAAQERGEIVTGVESGGEDFVNTLVERFAQLSAEHDTLLQEIEAKLAKSRKKSEALRQRIAGMGPSKRDQLQELQASCKAMARECRQKLDEHDALAAELERSRAKSKIKLDRSVLSSMIYDVTVRRHARQEEQIQSIVNEIGIQERRIAELSNGIATRYAHIESDMFTAAKTDAGVRDLFTPLVSLRGEYVMLVKRIAERGKASKEKHDVDSRLNKLMRFSDASMLESAQRDLQLVTESVRATQADVERVTAERTGAAGVTADEEEAI